MFWDEPHDNRFIVRKGDLLLTLSGSFRLEAWTGPDGLLNQRIAKLTPTSQVDRGWLLHVLRPRLSQIERLGKHALVNNVSIADIRNLTVPLPTLYEQRRIAAILDKADELRGKRRAILGKMGELTQALFTSTFGTLRTNPKGLKIARLREVCRRITDGTHQPPDWATSGVPFLFVSNINNGEINFQTQKFISEHTHTELMRRCPVEMNDVLYTTVGSYGNAALVNTRKKFAFQRHIAHLKPDQEKIDPEFLSIMLQSSEVRHQADRLARGIAQKTINLKELQEFLIFMPLIVLQREFVQKVRKIQRIKSEQDKSLVDMGSLFASLQHRAFRGEL